LKERVEPTLRGWLGSDFPRFSVHLTELAQEEWAGLGGLLVLLLLGGIFRWRAPRSGIPSIRPGTAVLAAGGVATLAFFLVMGSEMTARLLAAYYPLGVAAMLRGGGQRRWVDSRWFAALAAVAILGSLGPVVISPARPLVSIPWLLRLSRPVETVAAGIIARATQLYDVYAHRDDFLHELCAAIPAGTKVVGFMATADDSEVSCWRPFGSRRVVTVHPGDPAAVLQARGVRAVVVRSDAIWPAEADQRAWLAAHRGRVLATVQVYSKAHRPKPETWQLLQLDAPPGR